MDLFESALEATESTANVEDTERVLLEKRKESLDLQRQNFARLTPIYKLAAYQASLGAASETDFYQSVDLIYLSLSLFDYLTSRRITETLGPTRNELIEVLCKDIVRMRQDIPKPVQTRIAEKVIDALCGLEDEKVERFDPVLEKMVSDPVLRLIDRSTAEDDKIRYRITDEGVRAYLSVLSIDPGQADEAHSLLLNKLIERGDLDVALTIAERSRSRSRALEQNILYLVSNAERRAGEMAWADEALPKLKQAQGHLDEKLESERRMVDALRESQPEDAASVEKVIHLQNTLDDSYHRHKLLHSQVLSANSRFLDAQVRGINFYAEALPNLETDILEPLLRLPLVEVSEQGNTLFVGLQGLNDQRGWFDPGLFIETSHAQTRRQLDAQQVTEAEEEISEVKAYLESLALFEDKDAEQLLAALLSVMRSASEWTLSHLLTHLQAQQWTPWARLGALYLLLQQYGDDNEKLLTGFRARVGEGRFDLGWVSGSELVFQEYTQER